MLIIPHEELPRRRPVWEAMSGFFLDNELDDNAVQQIAGMLRRSGYSETELEDILETELAPLLYGNLCPWVTVAGVWHAFDVEWIESQLLAGKHRWYHRWYGFGNRWFCCRILRSIKQHYWNRVVLQIRNPT